MQKKKEGKKLGEIKGWKVDSRMLNSAYGKKGEKEEKEQGGGKTSLACWKEGKKVRAVVQQPEPAREKNQGVEEEEQNPFLPLPR